jgi:hypothetical protein
MINKNYSVYKSTKLVAVESENNNTHIHLLCQNGDQYFDISINESNTKQHLNGVRFATIQNYDQLDPNKITFLTELFNESKFYELIDPKDGISLEEYYQKGYLKHLIVDESTQTLDHIDLPTALGYTYSSSGYHVNQTDDQIEMYIFGTYYCDNESAMCFWKNPDKLNEYVRYGVHDIHLNSNCANQDGCLIVNNKSKNTWLFIATAFAVKNVVQGIK